MARIQANEVVATDPPDAVGDPCLGWRKIIHDRHLPPTGPCPATAADTVLGPM